MHALSSLLLALLLAPAVVAADDTVATVGGTPITRSALEKHVKAQLIEIETQRYETLKGGLDEMVAEQLIAQEAKARNTTPEKLEAEEVKAKITAPTDAEIQKVFDENKQQLGNATLEQVKPRIVEFLNQQKVEERREAFITELKAKYKTTINLKPPVIEVAMPAGRPQTGGAQATVTIIEFSDYQCPFCKRAEPTVEQVLKTYGDKVKLVYRHFPLEFHENARPAAEAAACANAQGKFWDYHHKVFASADLSAAKLKSLAGEAGLDQAKFDACFDKQEQKALVDQDIADASAVGVTGTPAFFINGRMLSGAQPFDKFKEVIDEELARPKS